MRVGEFSSRITELQLSFHAYSSIRQPQPEVGGAAPAAAARQQPTCTARRSPRTRQPDAALCRSLPCPQAADAHLKDVLAISAQRFASLEPVAGLLERAAAGQAPDSDEVRARRPGPRLTVTCLGDRPSPHARQRRARACVAAGHGADGAGGGQAAGQRRV